jgi:hypothetical protein
MTRITTKASTRATARKAMTRVPNKVTTMARETMTKVPNKATMRATARNTMTRAEGIDVA